MDQLKRLFSSISTKQRISLAIVVLAAIGALSGLVHWNRERDFKPLYTGLSQEDAGAVVAKVRESGTEFRLSESGSTVLVPSASVGEIRLQLAAAGIPKSGRIGFELFDKTNFGTSDFAEQVNYHRALEGELERSIMAISELEQARVHLTFAKDSIFLESKQPAKASVLVKLRPGAKLSTQNIAAICQLTASAVEGLAPESVSVVDMNGNLLNRPRREGSSEDAQSEAALEYRQKIERDLLSKINTTLEPLLGADKFRAGVFVDCDLSSGDQSEETFDPSKSVMVTSQKTEDVSGGNAASGVPGTASNLPRPASRPGSGSAGVSRRTENVSFQSSRTVRHLKLPQGAVKKISVSLLIDHAVRWEGSGAKAKRIVEPPPAEKLKSIHDLVAGVIGFTADRGDQLVVEALPFESTLNAPAPASEVSPQPASKPDLMHELLANKTLLIAAGGGALLALLLIAGAVMFLKRGGKKAEVTSAPALPAPPESGPDFNKQLEEQLAARAALKQQQETEALNALKLAPVTTKKTEVLAKQITEQAKKDPTTTAQLVRSWLTDGNDR